MDNLNDHHEYCRTEHFDPDDIVISGISGRFPKCESVGQLQEALFNKKDLLMMDEFFEKVKSGMPVTSVGCVPNPDKFDSEFFGFSHEEADLIDPESRISLEVTYEAIADAGYDPYILRGANIGIYNASLYNNLSHMCGKQESATAFTFMKSIRLRYLSQCFNFLGPVMTVDTGCSSSAVALWQAVNDLRSGKIDAAIVNGTQLNFLPTLTETYFCWGLASTTGNSIPFDAKSDGLMRAECVSSLFLQKASVARRCYAKVLGVKSYCAGNNPAGISVPSQKQQINCIRDALEEAGLKPEDLNFIESHGTGTATGDPIELNAIATAFEIDRRTEPFYIGAIKSSIGHTEASSGICGVLKAIICCETGHIPPNTRFDTPNPNSKELIEGKLKIVTEVMPLTSPYISVNSVGLAGSIVNVVVQQNTKGESKNGIKIGLPKLILYSATTEESVRFLFNYIRDNPNLSDEFFALLHKLSFCPTELKPIRGYAFFTNYESPLINIQRAEIERREVWFVYNGIGSQWRGMAHQLMEIEVFTTSLKKSAAVAKHYGFDLFEILSPETNLLETDGVLSEMILAIVSIEIALTDLLHSLDIRPDGIIGHSLGEICAAYCDGCITAEEAVHITCIQGRLVQKEESLKGALFAVGLSWEEASKMCPENVFPSCHNSDNLVIIAGPTKEIYEFTGKLKENVFCRLVSSNGYFFHCPFVNVIVSKFRNLLSEVLNRPRQRSGKWISTCFLEHEWNNPKCKMIGPDYFPYNTLSPVYFKEATDKIPKNAIAIEIGAHGLFQSALKKNIGPTSVCLSLMKKNETNSLKYLFDSLGKLYIEGLEPKVERLYPPVKFPVSRNTQRISDLIKWNHSSSYEVPTWSLQSAGKQTFYTDKKDSYLLDHFIDGRSLFPATGYIYIAWEFLAKMHDKNIESFPVVIKNLTIHRATVINSSAPVLFNVNLLGKSGQFEIINDNSVVAAGRMYEWKKHNHEILTPIYDFDNDSVVEGSDIYNELRMAGYEYGPNFQGLSEINMNGTQGLVMWEERWISFLDSLLLMCGIITNTGQFQLPVGLQSIKIDPHLFYQHLNETPREEGKCVPVNYNYATKQCYTFGIEITDLITNPALRRYKDIHATLEEYKFVPYQYKYFFEENSEIQLYMKQCNKMIEVLGEKHNVEVQNYKFHVEEAYINTNDSLKDFSENYNLLKFLEQLTENLDNSKESNPCNSYVKNIGNDILNCMITNEYILRIIMEIITENSFRKLNIVELNDGRFPIILPSIIELMSKYSHLKCSTKILLTSENTKIHANDIQELGIEVGSKDNLSTMSKIKNKDVVISSFISGTITEFQNLIYILSSILKPTGFILLYCKEQTLPIEKLLISLSRQDFQTQPAHLIEKVFQEHHLIVLSKISDTVGCTVYLLRPSGITQPHKIIKVINENFNWVEQIKKEMASNSPDLLWLVADDTEINGIVGLVNCLKQEPEGERIRCLFLTPQHKNGLPPFSFEHPFYQTILTKNLVMNIWKNGLWGAYRHVLLKNEKALKIVEHSFANCHKLGDLSSFQWVESFVKYARTSSTVVHIYYSALNFKDVMLATGKLSSDLGVKSADKADDSILGLEFSGRYQNGKRVAGIVAGCGIATSTLVDPMCLIDVPDDWSLEEAATVPVVYATCYYALIVRAQLQMGETILIHSGTGGIGIAAINIALSLQCEIFVTVGNEDKKKFLKKIFPEIKDSNIGCSRNTSFKKMIKKYTKGKGVDVVLNSLADDKLQASIHCLARGGRFAEIGKYDLSLDRTIGLKSFLKSITFHGVSLDALFENVPSSRNVFNDVMQLVKDGIKCNVVKPLPRKLFLSNEVEEAFRYMAKGVHVGKVLLKIRDEERNKDISPILLFKPAVPVTYFYHSKIYIIIGGLGGFGIEVAKWIISKGGRNIILTSRYGVSNPYHQLCMQRWQMEGINIKVMTLDVSKINEAEELLMRAMKIAPLGGIFNSAVVLEDAFMESQSAKKYEKVCGPKSAATQYLDLLTRKLCSSLDYFVCFSSISCGRGNAGQSNYGYANSVMERICEKRREAGLHGLAIQWGIIGEVGVVHRNMGDDAMIAGVCAQSVKSCLEALDLFCQSDYPVVSSYVLAVTTKSSEKGNVVDQIVKILGLKDALSSTRSFGEMGLDSLMGMEIKQLLDNTFDISVAMSELLDMKLSDVIALSENALNDETNNESLKTVAFVSSSNIKLPSMLLHTDVLIPLNKETKLIPIFLVHIGDTDLSSFQLLSQNIQNPIYALLWTKSVPSDNMESVAAWYFKLIQSKTNGPFHLIGYSLGGSLAFEIALLSENTTSYAKSITLLDGSSNLLNNLNKAEHTKNQDVSILCNFIEQFTSESFPKLEAELVKAENLNQRISIILNFLNTSCSENINISELSDAISEYIKKSGIIYPYLPSRKFSGDIILIENPVQVLANDICEIKILFSHICSGNLEVHRILSKHDLSNIDIVQKLLTVLRKIY